MISLTPVIMLIYLALSVFFKYLYSDHLQLNSNLVIPSLYAAQKYQIAGLISKCENYLQDNLAVENACKIYSNAKFFTMDTLKNNALQFIADNTIDVFENDDFLCLPSEDFVDILKLDALCIQEIGVIRVVLKWVDNKLTNKIDGKSRRAVLLKDDVLFTMAIPLLSPEELTSVVIPSGILTDEEQHQMFEYASISSSDSLCGKFRVHPRLGGRVVEVSIDNIVSQKIQSDNIYVGIFSQEGTHLHPESLYVKANKRIKIKSVTLNPQFIKPCQNKYNFNVDFETVTSIQNTCVRPPGMFDVFKSGFEPEEIIVDVIFEGRACKLPIDKVIPQNEILILTIKPNPPNQYPYDWESKQHHLKSLPQTFAVENGMMYEHELSQRTTLYLALEGGYLVESFEVMEIC